MAPLVEPEPQPLLPRQAEVSQRIVTLTVARGSGFYTTTITLGSETTVPIPQSPLSVPTPGAPTPTAAFINPVGEDSGNRGVVAGAVIGSVVGFLFLFWVLWRCAPHYSFWNRSSRASYRSYSSDSYYSPAPQMRHRGGGGSEWERKNRIRYPDRTWRRDGNRGRDESYERRSDGRRGSEARSVGVEGWTRPRRGRRVEGCLVGWLGGGAPRRGRERRERRGWGYGRRERSRSWSLARDRKRRGSDAWSEMRPPKYKPGTIDD